MDLEGLMDIHILEQALLLVVGLHEKIAETKLLDGCDLALGV